jgi:cytochrome P450
MIVWLILLAIFGYLFYTRIWVVYSTIYYYKKQGVPFHDGIYPVLGSFLKLASFKNKQGMKSSIINEFVEDTYVKGKKDVPPIVGLVLGSKVALIVNRPEPCEELFLTKNKYFDKHPNSAEFLKRMIGNSILFAKSDIHWQQKRKSLSAALYKEKLRAMVDMMKDVTIHMIREKWMKADKQHIDIVKESSNLFIKITLTCLFGATKEDIMVP